MAKFRFPLQPVLRQRKREEEAHQRAVAELERERLRLEGVIRACSGRTDAERRAWREAAQGHVMMTGLRQQAAAKAAQQAAAQRAAVELAGVLKRLERARAALLAATARRRGVELLRETRLAAWRDGERRAETREADDLAVMRHGAHGGEL